MGSGEADLFRSEDLTVDDACEMQGERIAYDQKTSREAPAQCVFQRSWTAISA